MAKPINKSIIALATVLFSIGANAAPNTDPVSSDSYIQQGNLYWAWASPVSTANYKDINILELPSFHEGWRFATDTEMASRPTWSAFIRADQSIIQAAEYWNSSFHYVDPTDFQQGYVLSDWTKDSGTVGWEILYVKNVASVPEPETYAMLLAGLGLMGAVARRKQT
jgi:hypothetical protein